MAELTGSQIIILLLTGIVPPVIWLWFWLKEDVKKPEPTGLLILSFFAGALTVLPALFLEYSAEFFITNGFFLIFVWATIEEVLKLIAAYLIAFRNKAFDEPVDAMVYLITVALGFAAFENILFAIRSFTLDGTAVGIITMLMRFLGANLLHVVASGILGAMIGLAYCKSKREKRKMYLIGILLAGLLHTLFNFFIINGVGGTNNNILVIFGFLWFAVILIIYLFEEIKSIVCPI